ncbi:MAG TPA: DUF6519 domain-containing protein, partial [Nocardioidaceae bacterium]|nr:DUF6519 domain-containing protein [Nocardioidaceae bacterium]
MAGDYSRDTFDAARHFSGVLMQQGRVQLDADWNEQRDLLTHYLRALAADVIGPHGGPGAGFDIQPATSGETAIRDFTIGPGHYYVDGVLAENSEPEAVPFTHQPHHRPAEGALQDGKTYLVYLDVWEQELTALQDDHILEPALKGADTAARLQVVWQVRVVDVDDYDGFDPADPSGFLDRVRPALSSGRLGARAVQPEPSDGQCDVDADSGYRGPENQLYRVQIHQGGDLGTATFVWSRDNASVALAVTGVHDHAVTVQSVGPDDRLGVHAGDWVEVVDDDADLEPYVGELVQVLGIDPVQRTVSLSGSLPGIDENRHPILRRWDHGALPVEEDTWLDLEDGVQIRFEPSGAYYLAGDYWQIPARTATADVEWPGEPGQPEPRPPRGVEHHVAPLARVLVAGAEVKLLQTYRYVITPMARPA